MSIFNGVTFNDFREKRLASALTHIHTSDDPAAIENEVIQANRLEEIGIDWSRLETFTRGIEVYMAVPITGEPYLFTLRVSTNNDPLPNCTVEARTIEDGSDPRLLWRYTLNQPLNTTLNAAQTAKTIAQQHVNFMNDGIRLYNQTLDAKVREATRQRLVAFNEASKVALALLERMNPVKAAA